MVLQKSFFPYEYCQSLELMKKTKKLPPKSAFYSVLTEKTITEKEYKFAKKVWKKFKCQNLLDYTKLYCKIDTILLSEVFQSFRRAMQGFSGLDPAHYISLASYSYDSMLKMTKTTISSPPTIEMVHMLENGKRGGMSFIGTRDLIASKKEGEESEIVYIDANVSYLPVFHFQLTCMTSLSLMILNLKIFQNFQNVTTSQTFLIKFSPPPIFRTSMDMP